VLIFGAPLRRAMLPVVLLPGMVVGAIGAAILMYKVRPGEETRAKMIGALLGFGLPPLLFWGLAALQPKNEGTLGNVFAGIFLAAPSGIAAIVAAKRRAGIKRT
jgi:hypothetical protein